MAIRPITLDYFRDRRWKRPTNYLFASGDALCSITAAEIPQAQAKLPLAFIVENSKVDLVALQGLENGKNLLVDSNGKWLSLFKPASYRCYPFKLLHVEDKASHEGAKNVLCIDESSDLLLEPKDAGYDSSEPFFTDDGQVTDELETIGKFLTENLRYKAKTMVLCQKLKSMELLKPISLSWVDSGEKKLVEGLFTVDEEKLKDLDGEQLRELLKSDAMMLAYGQLFSLNHMRPFIKLAEVNSKNSESELMFDLSDDQGSINFDSL